MQDTTQMRAAGAGRRASWPTGRLAFPVGAWAAFTLLGLATGTRMVVRWSYWQLLDPAVLAEHPWTSLTLLHSQPPLLNALAALLLWLARATGTSFELWAALLFAVLGLVSSVIAWDLARLWTGSRALAVISVIALLADPGALLFAKLYFYPHLLQAWLLLLLWSATRYLRSGARRDLLGCAAWLALLSLTRSLYHPLWALAVFALLVAARRLHLRDRAALEPSRVAAPALALLAGVLSWPLKNQVVFGHPLVSSWMGYYASLGIPVGDREQAAFENTGAVGPATAQRLARFGERYGPERIAALAASEKSDGSRNWNHLVVLEANGRLLERSLAWRREHPAGWARLTAARYAELTRGTYIHPYRGTPLGEEGALWTAWTRAWGIFFLDLRPLVEPWIPAPRLHARAVVRGEPLPYTLYGLVLLPGVTLAALLLSLRRRAARRAEEVAVWLALATVGWVVLACCMLTDEGNRVRFSVSPLAVLLALYVARELMEALGERRARRSAAPAAHP